MNFPFTVVPLPNEPCNKCRKCGFGYVFAITCSDCTPGDYRCFPLVTSIDTNNVDSFNDSLMSMYVASTCFMSMSMPRGIECREDYELSWSCILEKTFKKCLFCERALSRDSNWKCTCGIRDRNTINNNLKRERKQERKQLFQLFQAQEGSAKTSPEFLTYKTALLNFKKSDPTQPPVCKKHFTEAGRYHIPDDYLEADIISYESLLVIEAMCNKNWINYKNKFLLTRIKGRGMSAIIILKEKCCKSEHFKVSRIPPDFINTARCGKALVMLTYGEDNEKQYKTWRTLKYILKCAKRGKAYIRYLLDDVYSTQDITKLHPPMVHQLHDLQTLCRRVIFEHVTLSDVPFSEKSERYVRCFLYCIPIQAATQDFHNLVDMSASNEHLHDLLQTVITGQNRDETLYRNKCSTVFARVCVSLDQHLLSHAVEKIIKK
jgi:hypothetical protein